METWLWILAVIVLVYTIAVAISYKLCFEGLMFYLIKQGYTPPTKKELVECGKEYMLRNWGVKK